MRALLCYGATERNGGRDEARHGLAECRRFVTSNHRSLVRGAVGLHASFTVSDRTIMEAGALARALNAVVHVHVAEDVVDLADAAAHGYSGPLERLAAFDGLPPGSLLAHGVHLEAHQVRRTQALACWIVQNARSNRHNGVGYPRSLDGSPNVALGTDGFESDMVEERRAVRDAAAANGDDPDRAAERSLHGAELVARIWTDVEDVCGTCEREGNRVVRVVRGGRVLVDTGALKTGDMNEIEAEAREAAAGLWLRLGL
jgi:cytosine/adenosine deaminase-related metal-dependent hydrolase